MDQWRVLDLVVAFAAGVLVGLVLAHLAGRDVWTEALP